METTCHPDLIVADDGESYLITGQVSAGELPGRRLRDAWREEGIVSQLDLETLDRSANAKAFLMGDGSVRLAGEPQRNGRSRRRRNPEQGAAALAETWYGRPVEHVTEYVDSVHVHRHSADLGRLVELEIFPIGDLSGERVVPLAFRPGENVRLAGNEDGTQLFFVGQVWLDDRTLEKFGIGPAERNKELVSLGKVHSLSYHAAKHTHQFRPADYIHEMGERAGYLPDLIWSRPNRELILSGGSYTIEDVGIVN
jgi:hypothetical protein